MDLRDVKRLSVTTIVLAALILVWLFLIWLQDTGRMDWGPTESALGKLDPFIWAAIGVATLVALLGVLVLTLGGVGTAPEGFAAGSVRQVQCAHCKAVFHIHDTGHRPITHVCPSCDYLGVYDGSAPPVGKPPEPIRPAQLVQLDLRCQTCKHAFEVADTGRRPLEITCPSCKAVGTLA